MDIYEQNLEELVGDDWTNCSQQTILQWGEVAVYQAKLHEDAAASSKRLRDWIMFPIVLLASSTTVLIAISDIASSDVWHYLALVFSGLTAFITGWNSHLKPGEKYILHANAANEYNALNREVQYVCSLHPKKRPDVEVPFTSISNRFDNISKVAPFIKDKQEDTGKKKPRKPEFFV